MGAAGLSSRAIIGEYFRRLEAGSLEWVDALTNLFQSENIGQETVRFLGNSPLFRKWEGERQAAGIKENEIVILVDDYEWTLELKRTEVTLDKWGQVQVRIGEGAARANQHWASMLTDLIVTGETANAYDGFFFFHTAHLELDSGTQSNELTFVVSNADARKATVAEVNTAVGKAIDQLFLLKDDRGELMNEGMRAVRIVHPAGLRTVMREAVRGPLILSGGQTISNIIATDADLAVQLSTNGRLDSKGAGATAWYGTTEIRFAVFRTDADVKPFIRFQDTPLNGPPVRMAALAAGSEHELKTGKHMYAADARRGMGFGYWQYGVLQRGQ